MSREVPLVMPKMSMTMQAGELIEWTVAVGDEISSGDVVATVQTDKVDMDVEAPVGGTVARLVAAPGEAVDVGKAMAFILTDAEDLMSGLLDDLDPTASAEPEPEVADAGPTPGSHDETVVSLPRMGDAALRATPPSRRGPAPAVPFARRRAAELRVPLGEITGSGPDGLITLADVEARAQLRAASVHASDGGQEAAVTSAVAQPPAPSAPVIATTPARPHPAATHQDDAGPGFADALATRRRSVRAAVARAMTASATVPQFTVFGELDLQDLSRARNGIGWTTLLVRALARALRSEPTAIDGWDSDRGAPAAPPEFLGVALATDTAIGLLAPVVRDPDLLPVAELDSVVKGVIQRARSGRLAVEDLQGAGTTLSNLGGFSVPAFTSLLTPPQASALSVGSISQRPAVHHGGLTVRLGVTVGLTVDHRALDGATAAAVLDRLRELVEHPVTLLE